MTQAVAVAVAVAVADSELVRAARAAGYSVRTMPETAPPAITAPEIDAYCESRSTPHPEYMNALAEETRETLPIPQMMSGHLEGRLLEMLVHATAAKRVLELGTYSGYSALAMASAMGSDGRVITCEYQDAHADFAQRHIDASPYADRIEIRRGAALDTIATLDGSFELIFIDADKTNYARYLEAVLPLLAPHGLIVIDNTLWSGRVLPGFDDGAENTRALSELNDKIVADERLVAVVLPVRDGVTILRAAR
jgi:caffeoyl-CoA O-methyltransferase